jgi:hypothetical protein
MCSEEPFQDFFENSHQALMRWFGQAEYIKMPCEPWCELISSSSRRTASTDKRYILNIFPKSFFSIPNTFFVNE